MLLQRGQQSGNRLVRATIYFRSCATKNNNEKHGGGLDDEFARERCGISGSQGNGGTGRGGLRAKMEEWESYENKESRSGLLNKEYRRLRQERGWTLAMGESFVTNEGGGRGSEAFEKFTH